MKMTLKQLTIEATKLSDQLWYAQLEIEQTLRQETDDAKVSSLIFRWNRLDDLKEKVLKRMARRLARQVAVG